MTCYHKTYDTGEKAAGAWARIRKAHRTTMTLYQCRKCLGWRILSYRTADRLEAERIELKLKLKLKPKSKSKAWKPRINKSKAAFIAAGTGEPVRDIEDWLAKQAIDKHNAQLRKQAEVRQGERFERDGHSTVKRGRHSALLVTPLPPTKVTIPSKGQPVGTVIPALPKRKFAKRPTRAAMALAKATMLQAKPEWAITAEQRQGWCDLVRISKMGDKPTRGQVILAAHKLGPFAELPTWLQLDLLTLGVALPRTKYGRIPLGDALTWETRHSKAILRKSKKNVAKRHKPQTFYDSLTGYAVNQYGATHGLDYAQSTAAWVLEYATRDLRRSEFTLGIGGVTDKRKPHRIRKTGKKPNRWRKFSTRSLKHYWSWLVSILKTVAKHQGNLPENQIVLPYDGNRPLEN